MLSVITTGFAYFSALVTVAAAAAAVFPKPTTPGAWSFVRTALDWAALNVGSAKNLPGLPTTVVLSDVQAGVAALKARLPEVEAAIAAKGLNAKDDIVLVSELAQDLAPKLGSAGGILSQGAGFALLLSKIGIIR